MMAGSAVEHAGRRLRGDALVAAKDTGVIFNDSETRLVFGLLGMGLAAVLLGGDAGRLSCWVMLFLMLSAMLALGGLAGMLRRRRLAAGIERAIGEWAELVSGLDACENRAAWLQQRDYHQFEVRRWILHELGHEYEHKHEHQPEP